MDIFRTHKIHMIGIKGAGMAALACLLKRRGQTICGSDVADVFFTDELLLREGIPVESFDVSNIEKGIDGVIYSTAYTDTHPEIARARDLGLPLLPYPEALAQFFNESFGIAVAGSHGKTTTSAMLAYVMSMLGEDPSAIVGSEIVQMRANALVGASPYFVLEADEYQGKLAYYAPRAILLTNVDYDHPDFFTTRESYDAVFRDFLAHMPQDGVTIVCGDDPGVQRVVPHEMAITYGEGADNDYVLSDYRVENERAYATVTTHGTVRGTMTLKIPGKHNALNALGVIAMCESIDAGLFEDIIPHIATFEGTRRRFQRKGMCGDMVIVDDYAHHPTEVTATLGAAREWFGDKRIVCVFGPHTFSRTAALLDEFATSFSAVDEVLVLDIYGSTREAIGTVHARDLAERISASGVPVHYVGTKEAAVQYIRSTDTPIDILITMGASDVYKVGDALLEKN